MAIDLRHLASCLQHTVCGSDEQRKTAETFIYNVESQANYSLSLLQILDEASLDIDTRLAAAIRFKNFVKANWKLSEDTDSKIHPGDRDQVKGLLIDLMLKHPPPIRDQLSEAISIIGREDYPDKWPSLTDQLVQHFISGDATAVNGVLKTANSLFRRYRFAIRSNQLFTEIKFAIQRMGQPLLELLTNYMHQLDVNAQNKPVLSILYESVLYICKIFFSLNTQDLPEFFEDSMNSWMEPFYILLTTAYPLLESDVDEKPGLMEMVRSTICDILTLYAKQYVDEFAPHLPRFVSGVWELLLSCSIECKYDLLVSNAINFLAAVAQRVQYKHLFEASDTINSLCEKVIVPNMFIRDSDVLKFQEDSDEYIRQDLEGSNECTRRKAACDLVKALCKSFEATVVQNFQNYLQFLFNQYVSDRSAHWRSKDAALFLVSAMATQGHTEKHGVTMTIQLLDLSDFFRDHVKPELDDDNVDLLPIIKADCIKFVLTFRSILPPAVIQATFPIIIKFLRANSVVTHTYAASTLERLMLLRHANTPVISREHFQNPALVLANFVHIFSVKDSELNEYAMKGIVRSCTVLNDGILPVLPDLIQFLATKLTEVTKNPQKPHFNHYLFETIVLVIKITCKVNPEALAGFESLLFPPIQIILQQDVSDFVPYVFQVLAVLLDQHATGDLTSGYQAIFPILLNATLWESHGNVMALVKLLYVFVLRGSHFIISSGKTEALLGVFQRLNATKTFDHLGFQLLAAIVRTFPPQALSSYMKQIFVLIFQRLTQNKTLKYIRSLIIFFSHFMTAFSPNELVATIDCLQANMFGMVVERLLLPELRKIAGAHDRLVCALAMTRLLCEAKELVSGNYSSLWHNVLEKLVEFFELPTEVEVQEERFIEIGSSGEGSGTQGTVNSLLVFAQTSRLPAATSATNPKLFLAQSLYKLSQERKEFVLINVAQLSEGARSHLQIYFAQANLHIV